MDSVVVAGALFAGIAVASGILGTRALVSSSAEAVRSRAARVAQGSSRTLAPPSRVAFLARLLRPLSELVKPASSDDQSAIRMRLVHAGYRDERALEIFLGSKIALAVVLAGSLLFAKALGVLPHSNERAAAVVFAAIGFYAPNAWLARKVTTRKAAIVRALPDAMDLLVTCVEAGLGIDAAIARITEEIARAAPELATELRLTSAHMLAGASRAEAFRRLAARSGVEELRALSAMIVQSETFGTGMARSLRIHAESMRTRRTHRAEEQAATVSVKMMVPLIACVLPSLFVVILGPAVVRIMATLIPTMGGRK